MTKPDTVLETAALTWLTARKAWLALGVGDRQYSAAERDEICAAMGRAEFELERVAATLGGGAQ